MAIKNNKLFQACIPLALVLTFFCTPVFSLVSYLDTDKYTIGLSSTFSNLFSRYGVNSCFDDDVTTECASKIGATLTITFPELTNVFDFKINEMISTQYDRYSHLEINGLYGKTFYNRLDQVNTYDFLNVESIVIYSRVSSILFFKEVFFNFEYLSTGGGGAGGAGDFSCKGFSCWFLTEEFYRDVWLALLSFMVSVFLLAYLGRIIRTGGQS